MATADTPIVLMHGFWHGSWCWTGVTEALAKRGRNATAVDMAGHGLNARRPKAYWARPFDPEAFATEVSPLADVTLDAAGDMLAAQIETIGGGEPCLLVAHSMGGTVTTNAVQKRPELVSRMIYLTGFMPASGVPAVAYIQSAENEGELVGQCLVGDPEATGALRWDTGAPEGDYRDGMRGCFYNDLEPEVADSIIALLGCDAPAGIPTGATELTAEAWGSVPRTYIRTRNDMATRPRLQQRMIAEADEAFPDNPTTVVELDSGHSPFVLMPDRVAELIDESA